jgi:hypothetical protein
MKLEVKPALIIIGTLLIGMVLGALVLSLVVRYRMDRLHKMMGRAGFQQMVLQAVSPLSESQRQAVEQEIAASSLRVDSTINAGKGQIDAMIDSMMTRLDSLLTDEQRSRLHREVGSRAPGHGGPPPGGFPFGRPPPEPHGGPRGHEPPPRP